jgi:hypothetical protein
VTGGPDEFVRLGDLLADAHGTAAPTASKGGSGTESAGGSSRDLARVLSAAWPDVVGPEVAANARPVQLRQGRLVVSASSSVWAQTLHLMSEAIVGRLNERLGGGTVERIVFRHAGWDERAQTPRGAESAPPAAGDPVPADSVLPLSSEQKEALAAVRRLDLAPELRAKIERAMRAAFVRGEQDSVR